MTPMQLLICFLLLVIALLLLALIRVLDWRDEDSAAHRMPWRTRRRYRRMRAELAKARTVRQ